MLDDGRHGTATERAEANVVLKIKPRNAILFVLIVFALYAIITKPANSATMLQHVFTFLGDAVKSIFTFFDKLMNR